MRKTCVMLAGGILLLVVVSGCSTAEPEEGANRPASTVPGEVNPNAPDASQQVRTSPGFNF